jgi:hypothetical protein
MAIEVPESNFFGFIIRLETFCEWERLEAVEASHLLDSSEESVATKRFRISSHPLWNRITSALSINMIVLETDSWSCWPTLEQRRVFVHIYVLVDDSVSGWDSDIVWQDDR